MKRPSALLNPRILLLAAGLWLATFCPRTAAEGSTPAGGDKGENYFPPSDAEGGWRTAGEAAEIRRVAGIEVAGLDKAFEFTKRTTKNGGLLVVRHGWLVYERYFGLGHHEATANLASCGKSFTSVCVGMLLHERPDLFPDGLDTRVFTPQYFPASVFPLTDPRKADIKLGQLLAFTAGIRGNNPSYVHGKETMIAPVGPDGWQALVDEIAAGRRDGVAGNKPCSTASLWCEPGGGYSYATASIHLASMMLRHISGMEMQEYLRTHLAEPLGWGRWSFGYKRRSEVAHTPGGGGVVLRPTDMARFGYLMLRKGMWGGRQLMPAEYVRQATRVSPYNPHYHYSLQFDVNTNGHWTDVPRDAFWKGGSGGHLLCVVPSLDLVVWKLGGRDDQYAPADTGLKVHPEAARETRVRKKWKPDPALENEAMGHETIKLVLDAVIPPDK